MLRTRIAVAVFLLAGCTQDSPTENLFFAGEMGMGTDAGTGSSCYSGPPGKNPSLSGQILCLRNFGGFQSEAGATVATTPAGEVALTGAFRGSIDLGGSVLSASYLDFFLAKYDANCQHRWSRRF